ncbi:MAG: toll/interleukin-1 receptor domain-containing protein [Betaproteobacteria bacterium]
MTAHVFVSYSRSDAALVTPIVRLLRTAIAGIPSLEGKYWEVVFQDTDGIPPGALWKEHIDDAIADAQRMFVFWCTHSSRSGQVRREYELALRLEKGVVPVLLDDTPLAEPLSPINGVDLRELRTHGPTIRFAFPPPGHRDPAAVVVHEFAQALGMDPKPMMDNLFPSAYGPPA